MIVGITGLMGAGKTTATSFFPKSWKRISADTYGHALLKKQHIKARLISAFGNKIIKNNVINCNALAKQAFSSKKNMQKLNAILHPSLKQKILIEIKKAQRQKKDAVIDCALLQELHLQNYIDFTILITLPSSLYATRTTQWNKKEIIKRIRFQKPIKYPDFIIANTGSKNDLKKAIQKIVTVLEHSLS